VIDGRVGVVRVVVTAVVPAVVGRLAAVSVPVPVPVLGPGLVLGPVPVPVRVGERRDAVAEVLLRREVHRRVEDPHTERDQQKHETERAPRSLRAAWERDQLSHRVAPATSGKLSRLPMEEKLGPGRPVRAPQDRQEGW
jgi:hypothetical protein